MKNNVRGENMEKNLGTLNEPFNNITTPATIIVPSNPIYQPNRPTNNVIISNDQSSTDSSNGEIFSNCFSCFRSPYFNQTIQPLLLGQIMSLCLCGTAISSQTLADKHFDAPFSQSFPSYFFLAFIYGTILFFRPGKHNFGVVLRKRGCQYFILALIDVHATYLIVKAYHFTNLTSIQLLDCATIFVVMLLSWLFLSVRYLLSHIAGVAICLFGIALIIYADIITGKGSEGGSDKILGDILCLLATILYGISNVSEEFLIKQNDRTEYLGFIGIFGSIISGIELSIFEHKSLAKFQWTGSAVLMIMLFTVSMFLFYSLVSVVMQKSSALMFNLSVLTADFYSLLAGIFIFGMEFQIYYFLSFLVVLVGSTIYSLQKTKEKSRKEREFLNQVCNCCCPWVPLCCGKIHPPRTSYTVQDAQAEHSTSSNSMELKSEVHSSSFESSTT